MVEIIDSTDKTVKYISKGDGNYCIVNNNKHEVYFTKCDTIIYVSFDHSVVFNAPKLPERHVCKTCLIKSKVEGENMENNEVTTKESGWWNDMAALVKVEPRLFVHGPPGTGKTTYGHRDATARSQKVYNITLNEDVSAQEVLGHFIMRGNDTVWHDGPAIRAWKEGALLVINEIAEASSDVLTALYGILDDPEIAQVTLPNGATVRPAEGFRVIATSNEPPEALPEALQDRFTCQIFADRPSPEAINALPENVRTLVSNSYASLSVGADTSQMISYRKGAGFGRLLQKGVPEEIAARAVFGNRASEILTAWKLTDEPEE